MPRGARWLAPEVVQTSAMDCGPAALKCVLEGFGIRASYGRLREACQTSVDGTSIDTVEQVANQLGVRAEQVLLPLDHLLLPAAAALPAIVVVQQADGASHFVVVWRQWGPWLQVMDPATGRRWVRRQAFAGAVFNHALRVAEVDWRSWALSDDFVRPLRRRLAQLGVATAAADQWMHSAAADPGWFTIGALDAAARLVHTLVQAGGLAAGAASARLLQALVGRVLATSADIFALVPEACWSATPDTTSTEAAGLQLRLRGAVLLRLRGRVNAAGGAAHGTAHDTAQNTSNSATKNAADNTRAAPTPALSAELTAALQERPPHPLRTVAGLLRQDGLLRPLALGMAMVLAAGAIVTETVLLRGLIDISGQLALASQRLLALATLLVLAAVLLGLELPIVSASLRHGRHLETRLRQRLLARLAHLPDRYFQSRSVSDMADRAHSLQVVRTLPTLGMQMVQTSVELALTWAGVAWIAPGSAGWAAALVLAAITVPALWQPLQNERDLRLRNQAAALNGFYLDALLGGVPVRTHRAGPAVRRQHEGLLVAWLQSSRSTLAAGVAGQTLQGAACMGLAVALLLQHFNHAGVVAGSDLLLVYWTLKLPALASGAGALARQYPAQRNVLLRLLEPLDAPDDHPAAPQGAPTAAAAASAPPSPVAAADNPAGVAVQIRHGQVLAGGHPILQDVDLQISAGAQVAIVGASGAGKSSLVGLLLGWHRLAQGTLQVDGLPLEADALARLRLQTAWVDPAVQLWNRPLLDNLVYASNDTGDTTGDDSAARLGAVLQAAQLRGVLEQLPAGLQTPLGEGGALLSGGEGQRVRLGRAMLQTGVRLVLLDEPFRGLDRPQRAALLAQARRWWQGATLLCVTHDVGETLQFDRVLVVDAGRIVEDGHPAALAATPSRYAALLAAEDQLRRHAWRTDADAGHSQPGTAAGAGWRRIEIHQGRVRPLHATDSATDAAAARRPPA